MMTLKNYQPDQYNGEAIMIQQQSWRVPLCYSSSPLSSDANFIKKQIESDYQHTLNHVSLFDDFFRKSLLVTGEAVMLELEKYLVGGFNASAKGQFKKIFMVGVEGERTEDVFFEEVIIAPVDSGVIVLPIRPFHDRIYKYLSNVLMLRAKVALQTDKIYGIKGPKSLVAWEALCPEILTLEPSQVGSFLLLGYSVVVLRHTVDSFDLIVASDAAEDILECLMAQPSMRRIGEGAREMLESL